MWHWGSSNKNNHWQISQIMSGFLRTKLSSIVVYVDQGFHQSTTWAHSVISIHICHRSKLSAAANLLQTLFVIFMTDLKGNHACFAVLMAAGWRHSPWTFRQTGSSRLISNFQSSEVGSNTNFLCLELGPFSSLVITFFSSIRTFKSSVFELPSFK